MVERIVVPVDGSDAAEMVLACAALRSRRWVRRPRLDPTFHELVPLAERARTPGVEVDVDIRFGGDPADEIDTVAADAGLVVTTTHGGGLGAGAFRRRGGQRVPPRDRARAHRPAARSGGGA